MIAFLRRILDGEARRAGRTAIGFLRSQRPDVAVHGARFRAKEPERIVFAVVYDQPGVSSRPSPYLLVAVDRSTGEASFLETTPSSR